MFVDLVEAILTARDFRIERRIDATSVLQGVRDGTDEAYLAVGTMYTRRGRLSAPVVPCINQERRRPRPPQLDGMTSIQPQR